jgi:excisionase family DNA binding protein
MAAGTTYPASVILRIFSLAFLKRIAHAFRMTSVPTPSDSVESAPGPGVSPFLTANEVAPILRMGRYQVIKLCREGKLRATKPGKTWLILREDVDTYVRSAYNTTEEAS